MLQLSKTALLFFFLFAGAEAVLLLLFTIAYFRAMAPRPGTLDWVRDYDKPPFSIAGRLHPLELMDLLPLLCMIPLTVLLWGVSVWQVFGDAVLRTPAATLVQQGVYYLLLPTLTVCITYVLGKEFFGSTLMAFLCALIPAANLSTEPPAALITVMALLFLTHFLAAPAEATFSRRMPALVLAYGTVTVGCYFEPSLLVFLAGLTLLLILGSWYRFRELERAQLGWALLTAILTVLILLVLIHIPAALVAGLPLLSADFLYLIADRLGQWLSSLLLWDPRLLLTISLMDGFLLIAGFFAALCSLVSFFRKRSFQGLLTGGFFVILLVVLVLCCSYALPVAAALCLCGIWSDLLRRKRYLLTALGAGSILALELSTLLTTVF